MNNTELLRLLHSQDGRDVEEGLRAIGREKESRPSEEVFAQAKTFLTHHDEDLQFEAIWAVGLHWAEKDVHPVVLSLFHSDATAADTKVLIARSLGGLGVAHPDLKAQISKVLARAVQDRTLSSEIRATAYGECLHMADRVGPKEYAQLPDDINQIAVNWEWISSLAGEE